MHLAVGDAVTTTNEHYKGSWEWHSGFISAVIPGGYQIRALDGVFLYRARVDIARAVFTFAGMVVCA